MEVTKVQLKKIENESRVKALVTVTFDEEFVVHDVRLVNTDNGFIVAMPSKKLESGEFKDIAHPIQKGLREKITLAVLNEYTKTEE